MAETDIDTKQPKKKKGKGKTNPAFRKKTLRAMPPLTRKVAELIGDATKVSRGLKALLPVIRELEEKQIERTKEVEEVIDRIK